MSFSFIEIEEQKNRLILFLFLFLILLYFFIAWLLIIPFKIFFSSGISAHHAGNFSILPNLKETLSALVFATIAGIGHWYISLDKVIDKILTQLNAQKIDEKDTFHLKFKNIVEEASVAAGGKKIECRVIPTSATNAFALADFNQRCVIGVTEGLLARLNRSQLEAVIGHELAHIVSGDCLMTTITSALFGLYSAIMSGIRKIFASHRQNRIRYSGRGGGILGLLAMIYIVLSITKGLSIFLNLFISRQREYRADAIAVRLIRNPLALAEALHLICRGWRGANLSSEYLSSIFIISPEYSALDESETFLSNLFSTHPPIKKRLNVLLDMAHFDEEKMVETLEQEAAQKTRTQSSVIELKKMEEAWFIVNPSGKWEGPFGLEQLKNLTWLKADTWVRKASDEKINYAWGESQIRDIFRGTKVAQKDKQCPRCMRDLSEVLYEGAPILKCSNCQGYLLKEQDKIVRILARRQEGFSEETRKMAQVIIEAKKERQFNKKNYKLSSIFELACPVCNKAMQRRFYSLVYPVEIDVCLYCGLIWFDQGELEVLQLLVEQEEAALSKK